MAESSSSSGWEFIGKDGKREEVKDKKKNLNIVNSYIFETYRFESPEPAL